MAFYYLATPYSKHPRGIDAAHREACNAAALCFKAGLLVYSPIAHTHVIALFGELPGHYEQWHALDRAMIDAAEGMIVVKLDGWEDSTGIAAEMDYCKQLGKPIFYMDEDGPAPSVAGSSA